MPKFVMVMGVLSIGPVSFLAWRLQGTITSGIDASVKELHTKLAEKLGREVGVFFQVNEDMFSFTLAALRMEMEWENKQQLVGKLIETHPDVREISLINAAGQEAIKLVNEKFPADPNLLSRAEEAGFKEFAQGRRRVTRISREASTLEVYLPVTDKVATRILVSLKSIADRVAEESVGGTGFAVLVDQKGEPLFFPEAYLTPEQRAEMPRWPIVQSGLKSPSVGSSEFTDSRGKAFMGAYGPVPAVGGALITLQERDEAFLAAIQMKKTFINVLGAVIVVCLVAAALMARRLARPLLTLTKGAEAVSQGDFEKTVDIRTRDELQDLAETFNLMTAKLRAYAEMQVDKLVSEQRKTAAILYSIREGILMTDPEGKIQLANRHALEVMGLPAETPVEGLTVPEILPEPPALRDAMVAVSADPKPDAHQDVNLGTDKVMKFIRVGSTPVVSPSTGATMGVVTAIKDVTLEKEIEKMKEQFLHSITHDLRNPLGSAMGFIDGLVKGLLGAMEPRQHATLTSVQRSLNRLLGMINNILDIAKMESGKVQVQLNTIVLNEVAQRSITILEALSAKKKLKVGMAEGPPLSVEGDGDLLERVVTNLLGNAIKYTPDGGSITISVVDDGDKLKLCVADTGPGIPESYLKKVFEKFEQVTGQRKGGTGLGLTIAKCFVEAHLGQIWVESVIKHGSQFYFTVPKNLAVNEAGAVVVKVPAA